MEEFNGNIQYYTLEYDVLVITETWLNESVKNSELSLHHYTIYRCDRDREATCELDGEMIRVGSRFQVGRGVQAWISHKAFY